MPDTLVSGDITAQEQNVAIILSGHKSCSVTVSGTWIGTLVVESSTDDGTTWVRSWLSSIAAVLSSEILQPVNIFTVNGAYAIFIVAGITRYRVRATDDTAWTGTATIKLTATEVQGPIFASTNMIQNVLVSTANSSDVNLDSGNEYTFIGMAVSTLGVSGLQWSLKTDQNATVYVEESIDGITWDISRPFDYVSAHGGRGETVQASQAFWRLRVVLVGTTDTTYFRLLAVMCPVANALPPALTPEGRLMTESTISGRETTGRHVWVSPTNSLNVNTDVRLVGTDVRLVGTNFDGTVKDINFWTETVTNGGTVTKNGEIVLNTNTTANGTAKYVSIERARFVIGSGLKFQGFFSFFTAGDTDNIRRCGAYDANEGFFFELDGTTFSVGTRTGTSDTLVSSGSFNGTYGDTFAPLSGEVYYKLEIEWTPGGVFFYVNSKLLHSIAQGHLVKVLSLPITFENINDNSNATEVKFYCLGVVILRQGMLITNPTSTYITTNDTFVLKQSPGTVQRVIITSGDVTIYDGLSVAGSIIGFVLGSTATVSVEFGCTFSVGLTVVTTGSPQLTVVYE
jgi:hypothetical protein